MNDNRFGPSSPSPSPSYPFTSFSFHSPSTQSPSSPSNQNFDFLPGTTSLVEELDKQLIVILRDGRKLIGILRTFDQFANIVLEETKERIFFGNEFGEKKLGIYLIRGENVVLLGELDTEKDETVLQKFKKIPFGEIKKKFESDQQQKEQQNKTKRKLMLERGIAYDPFTVTDNFLFE